MLDIRFIRANLDLVKAAVTNKNEKADIEAIIALDDERREKQFAFENLRAHQNKVSADIALKKRNKEDASELLEEMGKVASEIKELNGKLGEINAELEKLLLTVPNVPDAQVPVGKDESANKVIKTWGNPPSFDFEPADHIALMEANKMLDLQRGAKISGSGFPIYTGTGAMLERSLIHFMLSKHIFEHEYTELHVPLLVTRTTMTGTGQLPKLEEDMYHVGEDDLFLIPTAEVPVTNIHSGEILDLDALPLKYVAYTPCFRREAGSYGKDTKGLQRLHQFNKVEMVRFVEPEHSEQALEEMVADAESILQHFGLHYRVIELCTGDLSFASARTYDIEVWSAATGRYLEVSSVSNFRDFQARRANIRYRTKEGKPAFVHTLNGSGVATPRLMIALVEHFQAKGLQLRWDEIIRLLTEQK